MTSDRSSTPSLVRWLVIVALALGIAALFWLVTLVFDRVHNTLVVIVFAVLFTYLVYPPVAALSRRGMPVPLAALLVYAVLAVIVLGAGAWLAPAIAEQAHALAHDFPSIVASAQRQIADPSHSPVLARLPAAARESIAENAGKAGAVAGAVAGAFGSHAVKILGGTTTAIIDVFLVLGLTLLVLGDLATLRAFGLRLVPARHRAVTLAFTKDVDSVIGGFVRGQVLLALAVGIAGTIVLFAVDVPYAILLGLFAGIVSIVPLVGPLVAAVPVLIIAFFTVGVVKLIVVAVLYAIILVVQQNVLTPLVVSRSVGVTPLVVFLALLFGSEAFGILGALLAIPISGILRVAAERIFPVDAAKEAALPL